MSALEVSTYEYCTLYSNSTKSSSSLPGGAVFGTRVHACVRVEIGDVIWEFSTGGPSHAKESKQNYLQIAWALYPCSSSDSEILVKGSNKTWALVERKRKSRPLILRAG